MPSTEENEARLKVTFAHLLLEGDGMARVQATPSVRGKIASFHSNQSVKSPSAALGQNEKLKLLSLCGIPKSDSKRLDSFFFKTNVLSVSFSEFLIPTCSPAALGELN